MTAYPLSVCKIALFLVVSWFSMPIHAQSSVQKQACESLFSNSIELAIDRGDYVRANGIFVSGESYYPLQYVLRNLGLVIDGSKELDGNLKILSIAEGTSGLLPFLLSRGLNAVGLDTWYHTENYPNNKGGHEMQRYVRQYGANLVRGNATHLPMASESFDLTLSHLLINNILDFKPFEAILSESVRVLKVGGEARIFGFIADDIPLAEKILRNEFGDSISINVIHQQVPKGISAVEFDPWFKNEYRLLTVFKIRPGKS
jgi:hypothetical protein